MNKEVYMKIGDLAIELIKSKNYITRAELSEELNVITESNLFNDGLHVTRVVEDAYQYFQYNKEMKAAIIGAFMNNNEKSSLISEEIIPNIYISFDIGIEIQLSLDKIKSVIKSIDIEIGNFENSNELLKSILNNVDNYVAKTGFRNKLSGAYKVEKVQKKGANLHEQYDKLVRTYDDNKIKIENLIDNYIVVRSQIYSLYKQVIIQLKEIFGSKITSIDPELFDYSRINWLDTDDVKNDLKNKYDELDKKCALLISEINSKLLNKSGQVISNTLENKSIKSNKDRGKIVVVQLGLELINSHLDSSEKAIELNKELLLMEKMFMDDMQHFKKDLLRLNKIDKTIRGRYLPGSSIFFQQFNKIISPEVQNLFKVADRVDGVVELKDKKDNLLEEIHELVLVVHDHKDSITLFKRELEEAEIKLKLLFPHYINFKKSKPIKPNVIINWLSLGFLKSVFQKKLLVWHNESKDTLYSYNLLMKDIEYYKTQLLNHNKNLLKREVELKVSENELDVVVDEIYKKLSNEKILKLKLNNHLSDIVRLLKAAKNIVSASLSEEELIPVSSNQIEILSPAIEKKLNKFIETTKIKASSYVDKGVSEGSSLTIDIYEEGKIDLIKETKKMVDVVLAWAELQKMKIENNIVKKVYDEQYEMLTSEMNKHLNEIDDKSKLISATVELLKEGENFDKIKAMEMISELVNSNSKIQNSIEVEKHVKDFLDEKIDKLEI